MNLVMFTVDGLRYKDLSVFGTSKLNTYVYNSFAEQGACFLNFRLPSPLPEENLSLMKSYISENVEADITLDDSGSLDTVKNIVKDFKSKNESFYWLHFEHSNMVERSIQGMYINQEKVRAVMELIPDDQLENTVFIVLGLGGFQDTKHSSGIFDDDITLYDDCIHAPLIVFHPDSKPSNITNSTSLDMILRFVKDCCDHTDKSEIYNILFNGGKGREDIYSFYDNCFGLRGPMFQYFCKSNNKGEITHQELFDLNNDIRMKKNLVPIQNQLSSQIVDLIKTYRARVQDKFLTPK